ncbi:LysR family transcriptional regulator [Actinomadura sp. NAK00032]|uniref:LysR family transcriptional regulator n=1 Tax=Actinomadura sp. NAK00032 TaxID=2742128 RepID=UPI00158FC6EB|nr:LysR substrate-binding domain-containing protein [Actinomadura sp. NAK00032]QKW32729.1 LysR family transcriptional regulator [Actinomadura sp. NAK00032]
MDLRTLQYFVAVAEELHFGRAAARLHMTQPPLSRAVKHLERDLRCVLLNRTSTGVTLTPAGTSLYAEARALLAHADQVRVRVAAAAGTDTVTLGMLADSGEQVGAGIAAEYRRRHPGIRVRIREGDFADPTAGLRAGLVDAALTRAPFDDTGIATRVLREDPVGVVLREDDPLADRGSLTLEELAERRWFRFPDGTDPVWQAFWSGPSPHPDDPVVRTVHECLQAVLWNGTVGLTILDHKLPDGLVSVPLADKPPSRLVVAWPAADPSPLVQSLVTLAVGVV